MQAISQMSHDNNFNVKLTPVFLFIIEMKNAVYLEISWKYHDNCLSLNQVRFKMQLCLKYIFVFIQWEYFKNVANKSSLRSKHVFFIPNRCRIQFFSVYINLKRCQNQIFETKCFRFYNVAVKRP